MAGNLTEFEIDKLISSIKPCNIKELGTTLKFASQHQILRRLHIQQTFNLQNYNSTSDYIKDKLIEDNKLGKLLKELISIELWRKECLPVLLKTEDFLPETTLPIDIILEHELILLAILETSCFHADTLSELGDYIAELVDYCHRNLNNVLYIRGKISEEYDNNLISGEDKLVEYQKNNKKNLSSLKTINLQIKTENDSFKIAEKCLSIIFHITNNFETVPISTVNRILNQHNLPILLIELLKRETFWGCKNQTTKKEQVFYDGQWHEIPNSVAAQRKIPKTKGLILLILFNLLTREDIFKKYEMSSTNISGLLHLQQFVSPSYVLEQFGCLTTLKAQLLFIH